jgi:serine/threonine protein kinase
MTPARQREKALFEEALNLTDPVERRAFLDGACGTDTALRDRLDSLFAAQEQAEAFLTLHPSENSPLAAVTDGPPAPDGPADARLVEADVRIGRYKLVKRLGEGGCGVVYLAEQQEPIQRHVALKIIRLGIGAESIIARFQVERQALAWMDHPNIARVLDAGATETGRPYFVMELVHGTKITDYCNQHRLDLRAQLDLFSKVCQAIQHAHQRGVIHRDIKPSNILVALNDGRPEPKVIDFGIATPIQDLHPSASAGAGVPRFAGTPDYVSPEQAEPDERNVDTRSDIYSLGVLLYELLTGCTPFDSKHLSRGGVEDLCRALRERPAPLPPSARVVSLDPANLARVAEQRGVSPRALAVSLRGDLDCVVMRAMEKDRRKRYETANGLAQDIRRYLAHEPVAAHPPTRRYHFRKLVRRNRQVFVAGALVLAILVAGLTVSTRLYYHEREARREQVRLRDEAEKSRAVELLLRRQAEAREKLAQAAVLINHGDIAAADASIAEIPLELTPPSLEAAGVLRKLGEWHAFAGRWPAAADRFGGLVRAITLVDSADTDDVSRSLLPAGAAICESGSPEAYQRFRHMAIARFAQSSKPIPAEHTLKTCLLKPADAALLRQLAPLAEIAAATLENPGPLPDQNMLGWRSFALALFEYRRNRYADALAWVQRGEAYPDYNRPRFASSRLVFALSCQRVNRNAEARDALKQARYLIEARFLAPVDAVPEKNAPWFDWINARILLREASALVDNVPPASPPTN